MKKYRLNYYFHKKPKPVYALALVVDYGKMPDGLDKDDMELVLSALEFYITGFSYKIRNSIQILGITHKVERTGNRIMIKTLGGRLVLSFFAEEYETAGV